MNFEQAIKEIQQQESKIAEEKKKIRETAVLQVKELVKIFDIRSEEIFLTGQSKKKGNENLDFSGFEAGKVYAHGTDSYVFGAKGQRPKWLKDLVRQGKTAQDLLKK